MPSDLKLTAEQIGELERLEAKATPGPWETDSAETEDGSGRYFTTEMLDLNGNVIFEASNSHIAVIHEDGPDEDGFISRWDETARRNLEFLAALRNHAPALIAAAKREAELTATFKDSAVEWIMESAKGGTRREATTDALLNVVKDGTVYLAKGGLK